MEELPFYDHVNDIIISLRNNKYTLTDHPLSVAPDDPEPQHSTEFLAINASHLIHVHSYACDPTIGLDEDLKNGQPRTHSI